MLRNLTARAIPLSLLVALALILPSAAFAGSAPEAEGDAPPFLTIAGNPLTIYAASDASLSVRHSAVSDPNIKGLIYPAIEEVADAGIFLHFNNGLADFAIGPDFNEHTTSAANIYDPWSQVDHTLAGAGSAATPWIVTTVLSHQSGVSMTLQTSYVNGDSFFTLSWETCRNNNAAATTFLAADVALEADPQATDSSIGVFNSASGAVGALNPTSHWSMAFTPVSPATHHWAGSAVLTSPPILWDKIGSAGAPGPGLDDTVNAAPMDNGIALQWNLPAQNCTTVSARWEVTPPGGGPSPAQKALYLPQIHR